MCRAHSSYKPGLALWNSITLVTRSQGVIDFVYHRVLLNPPESGAIRRIGCEYPSIFQCSSFIHVGVAASHSEQFFQFSDGACFHPMKTSLLDGITPPHSTLAITYTGFPDWSAARALHMLSWFVWLTAQAAKNPTKSGSRSFSATFQYHGAQTSICFSTSQNDNECPSSCSPCWTTTTIGGHANKTAPRDGHIGNKNSPTSETIADPWCCDRVDRCCCDKGPSRWLQGSTDGNKTTNGEGGIESKQADRQLSQAKLADTNIFHRFIAPDEELDLHNFAFRTNWMQIWWTEFAHTFAVKEKQQQRGKSKQIQMKCWHWITFTLGLHCKVKM